MADTARKLLELAAKACGRGWNEYDEELGLGLCTKNGNDWWNPLTDDGDALRLAVKLKIVIDFADTKEATWTYRGDSKGFVVDHGKDPSAATRCAIVRAAAEIGRAM